MNTWESIISYKRYGYESSETNSFRSEFIRDYDKILFMSAFRRLQNKTQVFPLPGNVFLHNRLTHSIEVASVGRSLGNIVGAKILENNIDRLDESAKNFYKYELSGVISSACLAHDIGNPAFGHSGEKAISNYFITQADNNINGKALKDNFNTEEWLDLTNFEGNANALRILTKQYRGRLPGGQRLMYITLASILKYTCNSSEIDKSIVSQKKYGYFQSEKEIYLSIVNECKMNSIHDRQVRHPFVYLVEAADDICYRIIDLEDGHRIGILTFEEISKAFLTLYEQLLSDDPQKIIETNSVLSKIGDRNEAVSYLRAKCISGLIHTASNTFVAHADEILAGKFNNTLIDLVETKAPYLREIEKISIDRIYNHHSVIQVELAGYNVMSALLETFVTAVIKDTKSPIEKKIVQLIPDQFNYTYTDTSAYEKTMGVLDFVSGMTDGYATEIYRKIKGIDIASHR